MEISKSIRQKLKKPLGRLYGNSRNMSIYIKELAKNYRLITVGDICTLSLLAIGIKPHLAVFDHRFMRKKLDPALVKILKLYSKKSRTYKYRNPSGTVSDRLLEDARNLIASGGVVFIEGEEDLTALAFIKYAHKSDIIIYGQPHAGLVVVRQNKKLKKKINSWLAASSSTAAMPL